MFGIGRSRPTRLGGRTVRRGPLLPTLVLSLLVLASLLAGPAGALDPTPVPPTTPTAPTPPTSPTGGLTAVPDAVSTVTGPDVSGWNHPSGAAINWGQVAASGQSFAFIKATEGPASASGSPYTNPWFASDWSASGAAGLFRGAYHFARPALPLTTAAQQANQFVSVAGTAGGSRDLAPVLDLEVTGGLAPSDLVAWTATWLSTVRSLTGRVPMVYTSPNFWNTALGGTTSLSAYRLWEADWTTASSPPAMPGWGTNWKFWQYTDAGTIPGISGGVDVSRFNGTRVSLEALAGTEVATSGPQLYLRNSVTSGVANTSYRFGAPSGGTTLMCDWDGNGTDTPGVFVAGQWWITNATTGSFAQTVFGFGQAGDLPVCGDWDGNGTDTPGIVRNGVWYLSNTLGNPFADIHFGYGNASGDTPVVGDWDGNGTDTPGVVRGNTWYLSNTVGNPAADVSFAYGDPGDVPVVGDWDGDGHDTPGVDRAGIWFVVNSLSNPYADASFAYGNPGDVPLTGRWALGQAPSIAIAR